MINELEKTFFDTFGIEPKEIPSREYDSDGEICSYYVEYPQISDRILLELICTLNKFTGYTSLLDDSYEEIKEEILRDVLFAHEQLNLHKADLSKQVRTLFEEG